MPHSPSWSMGGCVFPVVGQSLCEEGGRGGKPASTEHGWRALVCAPAAAQQSPWKAEVCG